MKIRFKNIPKFYTGSNLWYSNILDYDPNQYVWEYDTLAGLKKGDVRGGFKSPWTSPKAGLDPGRYTPTDLSPEYGVMGPELSHFNYAKTVEELPYYKEFTNALFDKDNKITPVGMEYIKQSDALLPVGHNARILNPDGTIKDTITVKLRDAHGRTPEIKTFNLKNPAELIAYIKQVRNDLTIGGRHNVFPKVGIRHYYYDNDGNVHWVNNKEAENYKRLETPDEGYDENGIYWKDYQLIGPKEGTELQNLDQLNPNVPPPTPEEKVIQTPGGRVPVGHKEPYKLDLSLLKKYLPGLLGTGRLIGNIWNNERVYDEALKGIKPDLRQTYLTHRQVVGDEATKLAYYRRAALGQTKASRPFTSDADRQIAYQMEAKRVGDELRALGDIADNLEIRRTSDESNLHQWANTQRTTEVANANIASMNAANALRHNLLALKHSANWTSIDNALLARETRLNQKLELLKALLNLIWALDTQHRLENNVELLTSYQAMQDAYNKAYTKYSGDSSKIISDPTFKAAKLKYDNVKYKLLRLLYEEMLQRAKDGIKISYKKKDDLLYKTTRDAIEHFLRMSKISSDAQNRRKPKIEKLTSHPKKYQLGGVAPFTVYRPAPLGGESGVSSAYLGAADLLGLSKTKSTSSGKDKDEKLDLVKELFKSLLSGKGLPSDVSLIYSSMKSVLDRVKAFGTELTSDDIAGLYLLQMELLSKIQYMKEEYDKARDSVYSKDALGEFAVTSDGSYVVLKGNEITTATLEQIKKGGYNPLTNSQVLSLRANIPKYAMDTTLIEAASNGIGVNKIIEFIKSNIPNLGADELVKEGYTKHLAGQIKKGLELLTEAPTGDYKTTETSKEQNDLKKAALNYIMKSLPRNMRSVLEMHALLNKTSILDLIKYRLEAEVGTTEKSLFDAVTGKASKGSDDGIDESKISSNPLLAMQRGMGGTPVEYQLITKDSNTRMSVNGISWAALPNIDGNMSMDKMLSKSKIAGIVEGNKYGITFGDLAVKPEDLKHIMYSDTGGAVVTLPCKIVDGHKQVNLAVRELYEEAEKAALQKADRNSPEFEKVLGQELHNRKLDSLLDSNGYPNKNMFLLFLVVEAYTTDRIPLKKDSLYIEKVNNPTSDLELTMSLVLSTDNKKSNYSIDIKDKWSLFEGTYDDIYRGTMFIPLTSNPNAAMISWGTTVKTDQLKELEELYQTSIKSLNYNSDNRFG